MLHRDAAELQRRLPRLALIDALDEAFRHDTQVSPRELHALDSAVPGGASLLLCLRGDCRARASQVRWV